MLLAYCSIFQTVNLVVESCDNCWIEKNTNKCAKIYIETNKKFEIIKRLNRQIIMGEKKNDNPLPEYERD